MNASTITVSLVTDEISADVETAVELGVEWGVRDFELRGWDVQRVPHFTPFQKQRLHELIEEYGIQIAAISPGLFKCPFPASPRERFPLRTFDAALHQQWQDARDVVKRHLEELLPASIEYAQDVGARKIVAFSFHRGACPPGLPTDDILETFHRAAEEAARAGLGIVIEVEDGFWADTGSRTAALIQAVNHPALRINWDPGNAFAAGDSPYPDGYASARDWIRHVHFKDVTRTDGMLRYVVEGDIDWEGQIGALIADGYDGCISVETHMQPKVQSARAALERLRRLLSKAMRDKQGT